MKLRLKYIILAISVAFTACGTESGIVTVPKNNSTDTTSTVNAAKIYLTSSDRSNELTLKSAALLTGQPSGTSNTFCWIRSPAIKPWTVLGLLLQVLPAIIYYE